jgi:hypothetical protein
MGQRVIIANLKLIKIVAEECKATVVVCGEFSKFFSGLSVGRIPRQNVEVYASSLYTLRGRASIRD